MNYYAFTFTPKGKKTLAEATFTRAMDKYEKSHDFKITNRNFEIGARHGKLHVHALIESIKPVDTFTWQKTHNICVKPCIDRAGWLTYARKNSKPVRLRSEANEPIGSAGYFSNFDDPSY